MIATCGLQKFSSIYIWIPHKTRPKLHSMICQIVFCPQKNFKPQIMYDQEIFWKKSIFLFLKSLLEMHIR